MTGIIDRQIETLDESIAQGFLYQAGEGAVSDRELEDLRAMAVALYRQLQSGVVRWQTMVADWDAATWLPQARKYERRYHRLRDTFDHIAQHLSDATPGAQIPKGTEEFEACRIDLNVLCQLSIDRMLKSDESVRDRRG